MAQTNPVQDQPSMDDILASIRRIIDDGSAKLNAATSTQEEVANDDSAIVDTVEVSEPMKEEMSTPPKASAPLVQKPVTPIQTVVSKPQIGVPELDSFLETLDAKHAQVDDGAGSSNVVPLEAQPEGQMTDEVPTIALVEEQISVEASSNKYEERFSETDRSAFAEVGSVLAANSVSASQQLPPRASTLVSDSVRHEIGSSFESLSEALEKEVVLELPQMTEQMLKPMLADWLDNNLPSMVERLVRAEIERIARGE